MTPEDGPLRSLAVQYAPGGEREQLLTAPERTKRPGQAEMALSWGCVWWSLVVKVKSDAAKNNIA